jgi:hypothetical protein
MTRRISIFALPMFTLASSLALTGCGGDDDDDSPKKEDAGKITDSGQQTKDAAGDGDAGGSVEGGDAGFRAHLKNVGTAPLDYNDPALWLCLPGTTPNECMNDITATEFAKDGTTKSVPRPAAATPAFDCFYLYPTVDLSGGGNTKDFSNVTPMLDPLMAQAAPFRQLCNVYAPLYRQQAIAPSTGGDSGSGGFTGDAALADGDVKKAFEHYMEKYNQGRRFVLIGHSQGSMKLIKLIQDKIDNDAALRVKLISALLIGVPSMLLNAPTGADGGAADVGGTFKNVKFCSRASQPMCVIAYNSFAKEAPPPSNTVFGKAPSGSVNPCTDPATLSGNAGAYLGTVFPVRLTQAAFAANTPATTPPAVTTPFRLYRNMFRGQCVNNAGVNYLEISVEQSDDDQRVIPPYRSSLLEGLGFGMHVPDFAAPLEDLLEAVDKQAKAPF